MFHWNAELGQKLKSVPSQILAQQEENHFFKKNFNVYLYSKERDSAQVGEGQRETETESQASSRLWVISTEPKVGLKPTSHEIMA